MVEEKGLPQATGISSTTGKRNRIVVAIFGLAATLAILAPSVIGYIHSSGQPVFWDAHVYAHAIQTFQAGGDAYARNDGLLFVYPPVFLVCASWVSSLLHEALAWKLYLLINLLALLSVPFVLSEGCFRSRWFTAVVAVSIFLIHPPFSTVYAFETGNIANILYALLFAAAIPGLQNKRWWCFYLAVLLAGSTKPPMLSFLLLPMLLGEGQALRSMLTAGAVIALNAVEILVNPAVYHAYLQAVRYQVLDNNSVGLGVFATVLHLVQRTTPQSAALPLLVHGLLFGSLTAGMYWARKRGALQEAAQGFTALTVLLALLLNPRMVAYDLAMLVVPMTYLVGAMIREVFREGIAACLMVGLLGCWFVTGRVSLFVCYLASLVCFPLAAYFWYASSALQAPGQVTQRKLPPQELAAI